jgi:hypothetical protein
LVYYGTFVLFTWDITEPMTYVMGCFNVVLFLIMRKRFGKLTAFEFYTQKYYTKLAKRNKLDTGYLISAKTRINEIERILN